MNSGILYINGEEKSVPMDMTISQLITSLQLDPRTVLIELNGQALLRHEWEAQTLQHHDRIEIFRVSAGG